MSLPCDVARCAGREWQECKSCRRKIDSIANRQKPMFLEPQNKGDRAVCQFWMETNAEPWFADAWEQGRGD